MGMSWLAVRLGLARLPQGVGGAELYGVSIPCGIVFTISLFTGSLAFEQGASDIAVDDRIGILIGSSLSSTWAYGGRSGESGAAAAGEHVFEHAAYGRSAAYVVEGVNKACTFGKTLFQLRQCRGCEVFEGLDVTLYVVWIHAESTLRPMSQKKTR